MMAATSLASKPSSSPYDPLPLGLEYTPAAGVEEEEEQNSC